LELIDLGAVALVVAMDAADCEGCLFDTANSTLREGRDFVLARAATARGDLAKDSGRSQEEPCQGLGCGQHGQTSDNSRVGKTMGTTAEETPPLLDLGLRARLKYASCCYLAESLQPEPTHPICGVTAASWLEVPLQSSSSCSSQRGKW
jgi:hypothetical protein